MAMPFAALLPLPSKLTDVPAATALADATMATVGAAGAVTVRVCVFVAC